MARLYAVLMLQDQREPKERIFRTRQDAFCLPEDTFIDDYRLPKSVVRNLCEELCPRLAPISNARTALSVETQVLCALHFFATGSYQGSVGRDLHLALSQPSVSRAIKRVTEAANELLLDREISFPCRNEYPNIKRKFMEYSGFPGVIGVIDCSHMLIIAPQGISEDSYINRKQRHSINVQLVCDTDLKILNINAKYRGRTHDAFIWRHCQLRQLLRDEFSSNELGNSWLLGDSGYPLEPWLMTPILNPARNGEINYNRSFVRAHSTIERCNGLLKSRFRCLHKPRTLHFSPNMSSKIINTCAILHNLCIKYRVEFEDVDSDSDDDGPDTPDVDESTSVSYRRANGIRNMIIRNHFD